MTEKDTSSIRVVTYEAKYKNAFKSLNERWISAHFKMEAADYKALDNPEENIIDKGGHILFALYHDEPVAACALIKMQDPDYDYELAKMAVSPSMQGKHIGWILAQAVIDKAKSLGARNIFLESNTILEPAINLYRKLGFKEVSGRTSPYQRANIRMAIDLSR